MKLTFFVLAMMTCVSELRAQTHIAQLQGIIQSGMQPGSLQPGGGVAVGPTNHIAHLQGIIQSGMQSSSVQPGGGVAVGPTNHITRLQGIIQSGMQPTSVQPGTGLGYGTTSASYTGETIRQVQTADSLGTTMVKSTGSSVPFHRPPCRIISSRPVSRLLAF